MTDTEYHTGKRIITVTLAEQGLQPGLLLPKRKPSKIPTARELTAADPIASLPGQIRRYRRGPWKSTKAVRHLRKMRRSQS